MYFIKNYFLWLIFIIMLSYIVNKDFLLYKNDNEYTLIRESIKWSLLWVLLSISFNVIMWIYFFIYENKEIANHKVLSFLTSFIIEKILSIDNVFVWITIFDFFSIPKKFQNSVLFYGTIISVISRIVLIFFGTYLLNKFQFLFYIFSIFLIFTSIKIFFNSFKEDKINPKFIFWLYKHLKVIDILEINRFFIKKNKLIFVTPLLIVLIIIGISNIVFSFDSIPAVVSITDDLFIITTSNIFAISGLRYIYFILVRVIKNYFLLKYGLSIILLFIGIKILIKDIIYIPVYFSLIFIVTTIASTILLNYLFTKMKSCKSNSK